MTGYGDVLVDGAEREGYISRKEIQVPVGKGYWYKYNYLTKKGEKLLAQLAHKSNTAKPKRSLGLKP